jgi:hypothetical protein
MKGWKEGRNVPLLLVHTLNVTPRQVTSCESTAASWAAEAVVEKKQFSRSWWKARLADGRLVQALRIRLMVVNQRKRKYEGRTEEGKMEK